MTNKTNTAAPAIEAVRALADTNAGPDDELDFYTAAIQLGATPAIAEKMDADLTLRVMRARGAV
jgi:hypothetical protein